MNKNKYLIKQAQDAYNKGDYDTSILLYQKAIERYPELAKIYEFNIKEALLKLKNNNTITNINDLYKIVENYVKNHTFTKRDKMPLVSIIMTTHNDENTVEQAIVSLLRQTYPNIEIIIINDYSNDKTWQILKRFESQNCNHKHKITIKRLNTNLGTYFAKNYGVYLSKGEYIFFQDADDISHPERIRLCMEDFFKNPNVLAVRGSFSRLIFPEGQILATNDKGENKIRLGYITIGVQKKVFDTIGYFNNATKSSDNELIRRLKYFYKKENICNNKIPLYYARYSDNSLISDIVKNDPKKDNYLIQHLNISRKQYEEEFTKYHRSTNIEDLKKCFTFPSIRNTIKVPNELTKLANPKIPVVCSLYSKLNNYNSLKSVLDSLINQVDNIYLFLNVEFNDNDIKLLYKYKPKLIIKFLNNTSNNISSIFVPLSLINEDCYFFTADCNITYPPDYVNAIIKKIDFYNKSSIIGINGTLFSENYNSIYNMKYHYNSNEDLENDKLVNVLDINSIACHSNCLKNLNHNDYKNIADNESINLHFAIFCKNNLIPMINVSKHKDWIINTEKNSTCTYDTFNELLQQLSPLGYKGIYEIINNISKTHNVENLHNLIPELYQCLK